jgi:Tfp pilus assembly protein FimT
MLGKPYGSTDRNAGFTLIELMIIVATLGILAAVAVPNFMTYRAESYLAAALSSDIRGALAAAAADDPKNVYPPDYAIARPSDLNQHGANLQDRAFQSFTYKQLDAGGSYQVNIVTFGGKEVCVRPGGIKRKKCA